MAAHVFRSIRPPTVLRDHDNDQAEASLRSAGCGVEGEELRQLAQELIAGTLTLARPLLAPGPCGGHP